MHLFSVGEKKIVRPQELKAYSKFSKLLFKLMLELRLSDQRVASSTTLRQNLFEVWYKQAQEIIAWDNIPTDNAWRWCAHQTTWCNKDSGTEHGIKIKKKEQRKNIFALAFIFLYTIKCVSVCLSKKWLIIISALLVSTEMPQPSCRLLLDEENAIKTSSEFY